jgi:hypothetical protein
MGEIMKRDLLKKVSFITAILVMACVLLAPVEGFAQGRGRGYRVTKKGEKFINGHDARDGRWDGRGPKRRIIRSSRYDSYYYTDRSGNRRSPRNRRSYRLDRRIWN